MDVVSGTSLGKKTTSEKGTSSGAAVTMDCTSTKRDAVRPPERRHLALTCGDPKKKKRVGTLGLGGNRLSLGKFPEPIPSHGPWSKN